MGVVENEQPHAVTTALGPDAYGCDPAHAGWCVDEKVAKARASDGPLIPIDARLLATIVHDLRNPLNVIALTLRVIDQMPAAMKATIQEDLDFLRDNTNQMERSLALLSDFCHMNDQSQLLNPLKFDPGQFLDDILSERAYRGLDKAFPANMERDPSTPRVVTLDPSLTRLALVYAISNAALATEIPLNIKSFGCGGRWIIHVRTETPPLSNTTSNASDSANYERLLASPSERRGLDLAMAAAICERLGGSVRLELEPNCSSTIVVELPADLG